MGIAQLIVASDFSEVVVKVAWAKAQLPNTVRPSSEMLDFASSAQPTLYPMLQAT